MKCPLLLILSLGAALWSRAGSADTPPNFIILLTDDQRPDSLGAHDQNCPVATPHIDRLAESGVLFANAFVTTPICAVSRSSILSGRYATTTGHHEFETELAAPIFEDTYPMHLKRAGYFVGQLGKYGVGISPEQKKRYDVFDAQEWQGPAFRDYRGKKIHDAEWLTVKTAEFLERVPAGRPFCVQVNYKEPHPTSEPAPEDMELLAGRTFDRHLLDTPEQFATLPEFVRRSYGRAIYEEEYNVKGDHHHFRRQYFRKVASVDRSVGRIAAMLEERGLADNTVIIFLSDHGTHFGEKQLGGKWTPYDASLRIPFIVRDPRPHARHGVRVGEMVLNLDVAPTVLELAGLDVPPAMEGRSLEPLIEGRPVAWRDHFYFEHFCSPAPVKYIPRNVGIRTAKAKYARWIDIEPPVEEFYDLEADPEERHNLIEDPSRRADIDALRKDYDNWRAAHPSTYQLDPYGHRPQSGAPTIDWAEFKKVRPEVYEAIEKQIEERGVSWDQAVNDWETRYAICTGVGYWY
jgi:arylsulfatase A-like enzyme